MTNGFWIQSGWITEREKTPEVIEEIGFSDQQKFLDVGGLAPHFSSLIACSVDTSNPPEKQKENQDGKKQHFSPRTRSEETCKTGT